MTGRSSAYRSRSRSSCGSTLGGSSLLLPSTDLNHHAAVIGTHKAASAEGRPRPAHEASGSLERRRVGRDGKPRSRTTYTFVAGPELASVRHLAGVRHDRPTAVRRTSNPRLAYAARRFVCIRARTGTRAST